MSSPGMRAITDEERQGFLAFADANPSVASQLPITLPSGFMVESFSPVCSKCGDDIPETQAWLHRIRHEFGQRIVEVWEVRGHCQPCRAVTPCYMRFRSDGTYDTLIGHQWRRGSLNSRDKRTRSGMASIVRRALRWLLGM